MPFSTRAPIRAVLVAAACASTASASGLPPSDMLLAAEPLFARAGCASGFSQCTGGGLPSNFCCPTGNQCLALAANTTTVCCPKGSDCSKIEPITCDLQLQNPETHPNSVVQTSVLDGVMATCGTKLCCPFGYTCNAKLVCEKLADQSTPPKRTPTSTSAAPSQTSTTSSTSAPATESPTTPPSSPLSTDAPAANSGGGGSAATASIAGGVIGGVALIAIVGLIVYFLLRRKRKQDQSAENGGADGDHSSYRNMISNPVGETMRSDFIRHKGTVSSTAASSTRGSTSAGYNGGSGSGSGGFQPGAAGTGLGVGNVGSPQSPHDDAFPQSMYVQGGTVPHYDPTEMQQGHNPRSSHASPSVVSPAHLSAAQAYPGRGPGGYGGFDADDLVSPPQTPFGGGGGGDLGDRGDRGSAIIPIVHDTNTVGGRSHRGSDQTLMTHLMHQVGDEYRYSPGSAQSSPEAAGRRR